MTRKITSIKQLADLQNKVALYYAHLWVSLESQWCPVVSVVSVVLTGWLVFVDQGASVVMAGGDIICGNAKVRVFVFCFLGGADTETEMRGRRWIVVCVCARAYFTPSSCFFFAFFKVKLVAPSRLDSWHCINEFVLIPGEHRGSWRAWAGINQHSSLSFLFCVFSSFRCPFLVGSLVSLFGNKTFCRFRAH